jgi:hypothetical protein
MKFNKLTGYLTIKLLTAYFFITIYLFLCTKSKTNTKKTMKKLNYLIALFILIGCSFSGFSQNDSIQYKIKIENYKSLKRTGIIVTITGATIAAAGGVVRILGATLPERESDDAYCTAGYILMGVGVAAMIPGLILHGVGKSKVREYQMRLDNIRTGFYFSPDHSGITLTYNF